MNNKIKYILTIIGLTLIISCTSTKKIQKNMNSESHAMSYFMDSKVTDSKDSTAISIDTVFFNPNIMGEKTIVKREKGWFLPLILVYVWNSKNKCTQGKSIIKDDVASFFKTSFVNEANRSGNFNIDTTNKSEYSIELSVDEIKTEGPYVSSGFFYYALYIYGYVYSDKAGPAVSNLQVSYKLKKGSQIIHSNSFKTERNTDLIQNKSSSKKDLQKKYAASMVEANSYNFKNATELIVNDLNAYFVKPN